MSEGTITTRGGSVWYKVVGEKGDVPLVVVHGGPGYPHDYLEPLSDVAYDRQVVFYDQLGCGNSDTDTDQGLWTVDYFVEELQALVNTLGYDQYHILGHSWGAALATAFALTKPKGLVSLLLSDPYISTPVWEKDAKCLIEKLPHEMQDALAHQSPESSAYKIAKNEYYERYVRRLNPFPEPCNRAGQKMNKELYSFMWGPEEYKPTGTLHLFDPEDRLHEITAPVLLLCGRHDEATPEACEYFASKFQEARVVVFEDSAHFPFWNEREKYIHEISMFLQEYA